MRRIGTLLLLVVLIAAALPTLDRAAAQGSCGTAPAPRLTAGQSARVVVSDGTGNNLRATANSNATVLGVLADGEVFSVLSGPQCSENFWWWQVRRWDGQTGWTAEGDPSKYWIEPWPVLDAQLSAGNVPNLPNVLITYLSGYEGYLIPTVMQINGQDLRTIGSAPSSDQRLMWSPDGSRLIFSDGKDLWLATTNRITAADGTQVWNPAPFEVHNLTNGTGGNNTWASFAPDGMRIVFVSDRDGNQEIYTANADGSNARNLTNDPHMDREPAWSPDGARIAFISDRDAGMRDVYTMSVTDGSAPTRITSDSAADGEPVWSRDGKLAYTSTAPTGSVDLWVVDPSGPRALTTNEHVRNPVWSPDGTRIAYVAESPVGSGREEIFSIRADGTDKIQYTVNGGKVSGLTWSPGGLWLVYADDSSGNYDLYAIRASGIGLVRLTNNPGMDVFPVFQPSTTPGLPNEGTSATAGGTPTVPGTTPGVEDLLLIYTANPAVFTLKNASGQLVDLTPLSFTGAGMTVPATIWTEYTSSPLNAFKEVGCLMVFPFELGTQPAPAECGDARQGWIANSAYTFWTQGSFTVNYNGAPIATCQTAAGRCSVDLP